MKILVSGSSGFVGSALCRFLSANGHEVLRLVRFKSALSGSIPWDPESGESDLSPWEGLDAVVHLAGETIRGRWTDRKKTRIRNSRVKGTRRLCDNLAKLSRRPRVLVCASATGFYGDRGGEILHEESPPGMGFLASVCQDWEAASRAAIQSGVRVVNTRFGMVLGKEGGALKAMLIPFRLGIGGPIGKGRQYMSWIAMHDLVAAIEHVIMADSLEGPVNFAAPEPVTNREFTRALGHALHRPAFLPLPTSVVKLIMGEMGNELLLSSARVEPRRLKASGFQFRSSRLHDALELVLKGGPS